MRNTDFDKLLESVRQAGQIKKGMLKPGRVFKFTAPNVKAIRRKLHVSQSEFAGMIGVNVSTLQNWEQGRRQPPGPATALLIVAAHNPKAVVEALHG